MRNSLKYAALLMLSLYFTACNTKPPIAFMPHNARVVEGYDFHFDERDQLTALKKANPEEDARASFAANDLRYIGTSTGYPHFIGLPEGQVPHEGFKVILSTESLRRNPEFGNLSKRYMEVFNKKMFDLRKEAKRKNMYPW